MANGINLSRRTMLAGSAMAFAMTLPVRALAEAGSGLPVLVQIAWAEDEQDWAGREQLIAAIFRALGELGADTQRAWVMAGA